MGVVFQRLVLLFALATVAAAQYDQCDLLEEERGRAQSKASNKDVTFFRLDGGHRPRSKAVYSVWLVLDK